MCQLGLGAPQSSLFVAWQCLQVSSSPPGLLIRPAEGLGHWFLPHLRSKLQVFSVLLLLDSGAHQLLFMLLSCQTPVSVFRSCSRAGVHHLLSSSSDHLMVYYSHTGALLHRTFMNHLFRQTISLSHPRHYEKSRQCFPLSSKSHFLLSSPCWLSAVCWTSCWHQFLCFHKGVLTAASLCSLYTKHTAERDPFWACGFLKQAICNCSSLWTAWGKKAPMKWIRTSTKNPFSHSAVGIITWTHKAFYFILLASVLNVWESPFPQNQSLFLQTLRISFWTLLRTHIHARFW